MRQIGGDAPPVAALRIANDAGRYGIIGQLRAGLGDQTIAGRALGETTALAASFTLADAVIEGRAAAISSGVDLRSGGSVGLADKEVDGARLRLALRNPDLFGAGLRIEGGTLAASLAGPFRDLTIKHEIAVQRLALPEILSATGLAQEGTARLAGTALTIPLALTAERLATGIPQADPRLVKGRLTGALTWDFARQSLAADRAEIAFPGLAATLSLRGNIPAGAYAVAGPVEARGLVVDGLGEVTANAKILAKFGPQVPWNLRANLAGVIGKIGNATIVNLAGETIRFKGMLGMGAGQPLVLRETEITAPRLTARFDSKRVGTRTTLAGSGRQAEYGPFTIEGELAADGPRAVLVLADPLPAAGLKDVRIAIAPEGEGFGLDVSGGSTLGPFDGRLGLTLPEGAPTRIAIDRLEVYRTTLALRSIWPRATPVSAAQPRSASPAPILPQPDATPMARQALTPISAQPGSNMAR